jgi:molecular chaperone IbpA
MTDLLKTWRARHAAAPMIQTATTEAGTLSIPLPGVTPDQLEVQQTGRQLRIRAVRAVEPGVTYLRQQIPPGALDLRINLAPHVEVAAARLELGVLILQLRRDVPAAMRPRVIPIASAGRRAPATPAGSWLARARAWVQRSVAPLKPARA